MQVRLIVPNQLYGVPYCAANRLSPVQAYGPTIADIAGGFTSTQAVGGWKNSAGKLVMESVTVFDIHVGPDCVFPNAARAAFINLAGAIARDLRQDCVFLMIDGVVDLVEPTFLGQPVGR